MEHAGFPSHTMAGGANVVAVFTNRLPAAPDLREVTLGLLDEGGLFGGPARVVRGSNASSGQLKGLVWDRKL
jgi:hypothetical protein